MYLKKPVILLLFVVFFLAGCSDDVSEFGLAESGDEGASAEAEAETPTATLDLGKVSSDAFASGVLSTSIGSAFLSYGGDTVVSVNIVDESDNSLYTGTSVTVSFTSDCVENGKSTIDTSVNSSTGTAVATYKAVSCEGADIITARLSDGASATAVVNVAGQILGALEFVGASPATLALKGSGTTAIPDLSTIAFSLKDKTGAAMAGETVTYKLSTEVGGINLSSSSSVTNTEGLTSIQLNSGSVNTSVVVMASVIITNSDGSASTTSTTSIPIAILGGIPDQDSFSISVGKFNPQAWDIDGAVSMITISAGDRYNNPARNGTQVSFVTSGGAIVGSCALAAGACSVNWTSQDPRPTSGLVEILARTIGEESFTDSNSNGVYDLGEVVRTNLSEAFLDANQSGSRDSDDEFFSDFNRNETYDQKVGTVFQGTNCSAAAELDGHCANLVDVRASATLCMSDGRFINLQNDVGGFIDLATGPKGINFNISDSRGLTPPVGTTISFSVVGAEIVSGATVVIPDECDPNGYDFGLVLKSTTTLGDPNGSLTVKVLKANGVSEDYTMDLNLF